MVEQWEKVIAQVEADKAEVEALKAEAKELYRREKDKLSVDEFIKLQSHILRTSDLVSQQRIKIVELERQLDEVKRSEE